MIVLRPADPTRPIVIGNATATEIEDPPEGWLRDEAEYVIQTPNVEVHET